MAKSKSQEKREKIMAEAKSSTPADTTGEANVTPEETPKEAKQPKKISLVGAFHASLAQFEKDAVKETPAKAVPLFRRWVEDRGDAELAELLA